MLNDQERLQHKKEVAELVIKDIELLEGDVRKGMFPAETEPEQIIELVKALASLSGGIDVVNLQKILGIHSDEMERLVNASQILGFTSIHNGLIWLSGAGTELGNSPMSKKRQLISERISLLEPFRTAIDIATKSKSFSSDKVADVLSKKDLRWAEEEELNELLVHDILVDCAVFAGLLEYDGRTDMFSLRS